MMRIDSLKFQSVVIAFSCAFSLYGCGSANEHPVKTPVREDPLERANRSGGQPQNPLLVAERGPNEGGVKPGEQFSREAMADPGRMVAAEPLRSAKNLVPAQVTSWKMKDLVPFQLFPAVPSSLIGIIWSAGRQPWGSGYEHSATPSSSTDRIEYKFGVNGSSPYAVYFVSDGRGYNFLRNWSVPIPSSVKGQATYTQYNAAMFGATTKNDWGLSRLAHLVEVDVNDKRGGFDIHFVITKARVVDGTSAFPPRADDVLIGLRARFNEYLATQEEAIQKKVDAAVKAKQKSLYFEQRVIGVVGVFPTWNSAQKAMDVVFTRVTTQTGRSPAAQSMVDPCPPCPPGAPCAQCDEGRRQPTPVIEISVPTAVRYLVDKSGEVVGETRYLPVAPEMLERAAGD